MLKRIRISVVKPLLLPVNLEHVKTVYKISKTLSFTGSDLLVNETSDVLYDKNFTININKDDTVYIVTQYVYKVLDLVNGGYEKDTDGNDILKYGTPSRISSLKSNQEGVKISDTIVDTPTIIIGTSYNYNIDGNVMLKGSEFKMFSSVGVHKASTWIVKDVLGNILFKREKDQDNLTSIILPEKFKLEDNFIVYCMYHSDTNADSNYGLKENISTNELPKFNVKNVSNFIVGKKLYFEIEILNKRFKNIKLEITDVNGNVNTINNLKSSLISVSTTGYLEHVVYNFKFTITSENDITVIKELNLLSHNYKDMYNINKVYLDKYDYLGYLFTNGEVNNFSYELSNGKILIEKNSSTDILDSEFIDKNLIFLDSVLTINNEKIYNGNLYANELLNGDVVVCYKNTQEEVTIATYQVNPVDNSLSLVNSIKLESKEPLTYSGAITISGNYIYFIDYKNNQLVKLNPYSNETTYFTLPYAALHSISLVTTLENNIIMLGGTNDNIKDFDIVHQRVNDKAFIFDITNNTFSEIGTNVLESLTKELYQFHLVYRHDDKITMFNNLNTNNYNAIGDQSTYILTFKNTPSLLFKYNDHLDSIPYINTIVLKNGDVIRFTSLPKDPQKAYLYISDSTDASSIVDNNTLVYDPSVITIGNGEYLHLDNPCKYDVIKVGIGGSVSLGDDTTTKYDHTCLIITRDTVMNTLEFEENGYTLVYKACSEARFILNR